MILSDFKLHHWPGLATGFFIFTILLSYIIAVWNGHVYYFFPYISDAGSTPPESCIFGQLINIHALIIGITLYIRYRQVDFDIKAGGIENIPKTWNPLSIKLAAAMSLGITVVGNFQETALILIHLGGAFLTFFSGIIYFFIQTRISFASRPAQNIINSSCLITNNVLYLRILLACSFVPLFCLVGICGVLAIREFKGTTYIWWTEKEGAFGLRLISTFSEWALAILMHVYIFTFKNEFKSLLFKEVSFIASNRRKENNNCISCKNGELKCESLEINRSNGISPEIYRNTNNLLKSDHLRDTSTDIVAKENFMTETIQVIKE